MLPVRLLLVLLLPLLLGACAANQLHGFQNAYHGHDVPDAMLARIRAKFDASGLGNARVVRDNVGRVQLAGSYRDEDEVDRAFLIVQAIVGMKATSPFYPEDVKEKRWEAEAARALAEHARAGAARGAAAQKRALVVGINHFLDSAHIKPIQGEDDAVTMRDLLQKSGYRVTALLGAQATKAAIEAALARIERETGPDDSLLIYISSHGTQPVPSPRGGDQRKMSIVAYDSGDVGGRRSRDTADYLVNLQNTSVSDLLVQRVARKPTRVTRVLLDTCYSGEILKDVPDESRDFIRSRNGGQPERAGISMEAWTGPEFTSKEIRFAAAPGTIRTPAAASAVQPPAAGDADRSRAGYTIITATSENQESLGPPVAKGTFASPLSPSRELKGSFFTQAFLEYLRHHDGQVHPAFDDARRFTEQKAQQVSGGAKQQVPRHYSTLPPPRNNLYQ